MNPINQAPVNRIEIDARIAVYLLAEEDDANYHDIQHLVATVSGDLPEFEFHMTDEFGLADLVVAYARTTNWAREAIGKIRANSKHFLLPILLISLPEVDNLDALVDAQEVAPVSSAGFESRFRTLLHVSRRVQDLVAIPDTLGDRALRKIQTLRFLHTRKSRTYSPRRDHRARVGYKFPLIQLLFDLKPGEEVSVLEELEEAQLLTSKLVDKVNICPFCEHTQINFREICPICRSLNISEETAIHHFRCAYIGKESEFRDDLNLRCPKCSRELRHIGVDYDKPSAVLWCNDCNHNFSDPLLSYYCLACANSFPPENTLIKRISEYELSQDGAHAAEEGRLPGSGLLNILKKELGLYKREVFMEMLRLELARCRRYKYNSTLSRFNLKSADKTLSQDGVSLSRKFKNDFAAVINQTFRNTDLFTDVNDGDILGIFTNTNSDNAAVAFNRLSHSINQVATKKIDLRYQLIDLAAEENSLDIIKERFM
ncbi:MAG: hypothetical protein ACE5G1_10540 [bacterium]